MQEERFDRHTAQMKAIDALERDRWISVEERLPKGGDKTIGICENISMLFDDGNVYPGWMNGWLGKSFYLNERDDFVKSAPISRVKAWRPLPEPPGEDGK